MEGTMHPLHPHVMVIGLIVFLRSRLCRLLSAFSLHVGEVVKHS